MDKIPTESRKDDLQKLQNWTKTAQANSERLARIYKDLCEYEDLLNEQESEEDMQKIFELLEMINDIHKTACKLRPTCDSLNKNNQNIQDQMTVLDKAFNLLQLQQKHKAINN